MMSLTKINMKDAVKKQYAYKFKAYIQVFMSLIFLQLLAVFFSLNGVGAMGGGDGMLEVNVKYYSADFVVAFTILWGFITAIIITTKAYRYDDFLFVSNRISSSLSNILFLMTASVIGGITAVLSNYLLKMIVYLFVSDYYIKSIPGMSVTTEILIGTLSTMLYVFLASALGYLIGILVQWSKAFVVLLPAAFFGELLLDGARGKTGMIGNMLAFFFTDASLPLFFIKIIVTVALLFSGAVVLSNRMEARP